MLTFAAKANMRADIQAENVARGFFLPRGPIQDRIISSLLPVRPVVRDAGVLYLRVGENDRSSRRQLIQERVRVDQVRDANLARYAPRNKLTFAQSALLALIRPLNQIPYIPHNIGMIGNIHVDGNLYLVKQTAWTDTDFSPFVKTLSNFEDIARRVVDAFNRNRAVRRRRAPPAVKKLIALSAYIYRHLFINKASSRAYFYLMFNVGVDDIITGQTTPHSPYFKVRLSSNRQVQIFEVLYMTLKIATVYISTVDEYRAGSDEERATAELSNFLFRIYLRESLFLNHTTFSHAIRDARRTTSRFDAVLLLRRNGRHANESSMQRSFKFLFAWLKKVDYKLTSGGTYKNCLGRAITLSRMEKGWEELTPLEKKRVNTTASRFSKKIPDFLRDEGEITLEAFSEAYLLNPKLLKRHERVVFLDFELSVIKTVGYGAFSTTTLYVLIFGGHALGIVPNNGAVPPEEKYELIPTISTPEYIREDIATYDFETTAEEHPQVYAAGLHYAGVTDIFFTVETALSEFVAACFLKLPNKTRVFAHFGGKFDVILLYSYLARTDRYFITDICDLHGTFLRLAVGDKQTRVAVQVGRRNAEMKPKLLYFQDSYPLLGMSLSEAAKKYQVPQKLSLPHTLFTPEAYIENWYKYDGEDYLRRDCEALYLCLKAFSRIMKETLDISPLYLALTRPAIARVLFLSRYYNVEDYPLYHLPERVHFNIQKAFYGGRTQVFKRGHFRDTEHPLQYKDINSMYPSVMKGELPYGIPIERKFTEIPEDFYGFVNVVVTGGRKRGLNPLRYKSKHGLIAPIFKNPVNCWYFADEVRFAQNPKFQYTIEILGGLEFKHAPFLSNIVDVLYAAKVYAKSVYGKNSAEYDAAKVQLNSLYGFFALRMYDRKLSIITSKYELAVYLATGTLHDKRGDLCYVTKKNETSVRYLPIAATITALAHLKLIRTIDHIESNGFTVYYCDTDSIITDAPNRYLGSPCGDELGEWSDECPPGFELVTVAPKLYAIRGYFVKCKGFSKGTYHEKSIQDGVMTFSGHKEGEEKLSFDDIVGVLNGTPIRCSFTNFRCGRMGMLAEHVGLTCRVESKTFNGRIYKGKVRTDGTISPLKV